MDPGAALSHLAMFTLSENGWNIKKTYTFEAPRVGNKVAGPDPNPTT